MNKQKFVVTAIIVSCALCLIIGCETPSKSSSYTEPKSSSYDNSYISQSTRREQPSWIGTSGIRDEIKKGHIKLGMTESEFLSIVGNDTTYVYVVSRHSNGCEIVTAADSFYFTFCNNKLIEWTQY